MKLAAILFLIFINFLSYSQSYSVITQKADYFSVLQISYLSTEALLINTPHPITALSVKSDTEIDFTKLFIVHQNDTFSFKKDEESGCNDCFISNLIEFNHAIDSFYIFSHQKIAQFEVHTYNSIYLQKPEYRSSDSSHYIDCSKPQMIFPDEWRSGLPAPSVKPTYTATEHIVIHHTSGSNTQTDHLLTIRNIYLYHTQTNGWDDIGYNYLIARDGTIYQGRDAQNLMADDYVKGAHFCGKNANTMAISMMGDYSVDLPTPQALLSLKKLLLWKLNKEHLNPYDSFEHPKSAADAILLPALCGHRDGCATECPGTSFYVMLPKIKNEIDSLLDLCNPEISIFTIEKTTIHVFPNPFYDILHIKLPDTNPAELILYDFKGKRVFYKYHEGQSYTLSTKLLPNGLYLLRIVTDTEDMNLKLLKN